MILNTIVFVVSDHCGGQEGRSHGATEVELLQNYHHHPRKKTDFLVIIKLFSISLFSQNEYHHSLNLKINLILPALNFSIRQLLTSFRTFCVPSLCLCSNCFCYCACCKANEMMWRKQFQALTCLVSTLYVTGTLHMYLQQRRRAWTESEWQRMIHRHILCIIINQL